MEVQHADSVQYEVTEKGVKALEGKNELRAVGWRSVRRILYDANFMFHSEMECSMLHIKKTKLYIES